MASLALADQYLVIIRILVSDWFKLVPLRQVFNIKGLLHEMFPSE